MMPSLYRTNSTDSDLEPLYYDGRLRHRRLKNFLAGVFIGAICLVAIVAMVVTSMKLGTTDNHPSIVINVSPIVNASCGYMQGRQEDGIFVFRAIPYATPPVGELRWRAPQSLESTNQCWDGILRAYSHGSKCYQLHPETQQQEGDEDCLLLNIWTPQLYPSADLHVMVFIHGGGLMYKSGNEPGETPTPELVKNTNMVYVTFNYRLNAFGFMALDILSEHSPTHTSGNYGLQDQVAALQWVQKNIHTFGGNPEKVTIFGHEMGGGSVGGLLASPSARGLFHRAWAMSGLPVYNTTLKQAEHNNAVFLNLSGCDFGSRAENMLCLQNLTPEQIIEATPWRQFPSWARLQYNDLPTPGDVPGAIAVIDGTFFPAPPHELYEKGEMNDVPLLLGNTAQESDAHPLPENLQPWTWARYDNYLHSKLSVFKANLSSVVIGFYPHQVSPEYQFTSMVTDIRVTCPTNQLAASMATSFKSPVYRYVVTAIPSKPINENGHVKTYAFTGWDLLAFFGTIPHYIDNPSHGDLQFGNNVRKMVMDFVKDGEMLTWKEGATTLVSEEIEISESFKQAQCDLWMANSFYPEYAMRS